MYFLSDITPFVSEFFDLIIYMFTECYNKLDSITFAGISLLQFILTIGILGTFLTLILTQVPSYSVSSTRCISKRK